MTKISGLGSKFYIGGFDLSGDVSAVSKVSAPMNTADVTAIQSQAMERIGLVHDAGIDFTTLFEDTTSVSSPGVPATTVPLISTYNFSVYVTITGGTMTNVSINGSTVGTGAGTYILPALGTITLTYTVAPTWSWAPVNTEHDLLSTLPTTDQIVTFFVGAAVGNPAASMIGKQLNYDPTRAQAGDLSMAVSAVANGHVMDWGVQLTAGAKIDTAAATSGTTVNQLAATSFGWQAYAHTLNVVGTSCQLKLEDSPDNSTWTALTGGAFTAVNGGSAPTAQRLAGSTTATVNQYIRVVSQGTFSYARYVVQFTRNASAPLSGL